MFYVRRLLLLELSLVLGLLKVMLNKYSSVTDMFSFRHYDLYELMKLIEISLNPRSNETPKLVQIRHFLDQMSMAWRQWFVYK
jgi:hypothetical protein